MIQFGDMFVDEASIVAIEPRPAVMPADPKVMIYLKNGRVLTTNVSMDEVRWVLTAAGYLDQPDAPLPVSNLFSDAELAELKQAMQDGFFFAAKDKTGLVYTFRELPEKHGAYWGEADGTRDSRRLSLEYKAMSFEDAEPLYIPSVFAAMGVARCRRLS